MMRHYRNRQPVEEKPVPAGYYRVSTRCSNCGYMADLDVKKGTPLGDVVCDDCEIKALVLN